MQLPPYERISAYSMDDLIRVFNDFSDQNIHINPNFIREEIARREHAAQTQEMLSLTRTIRSLTIAVTVLTVANVVAVVISLLR